MLFKPADSNKPITVVFVDIDGVLLRSSDWQENENQYKQKLLFIKEKLGEAYNTLQSYDIGAALLFESTAVANLKQLFKETHAQIVISSQWRIPNDKDYSLRRLRLLFKLWDLDALIIDETPHLKRNRAEEIQAWLTAHKGKFDKFVILDDIDLSREFPDNWIDTRKKMYFSEKNLEEARSILNPEVLHPTTSPNIQGPELPFCDLNIMPTNPLDIMPATLYIPWLTNQLSWCFALVLQVICTSIAATSTDMKALSFCNTTASL